MIAENTVSIKQLPRFFSQLIFLILSLSLLTGCEKSRTIVTGLDEKDANEILVFLATKGINAEKVRSQEAAGGGAKLILFDISVPEPQATEAMSILNQAGLPRRTGQSLLGIFSNVGLVPSEMQERIRYQSGLAEQIASTIRKFDGILDAEVQISFPEEDPLNPGKQKGDITASVYVKHSGVLDDPNVHLVTKIRRLVTGAVTGLKYDNVTVISDRARFTDYASGLVGAREEDRNFVSIWSIIIAQESLTRFRIIFFTFTLITLLLLLAFVWIGWKVFPLLKEHGGVSSLFSLTPVQGAKKDEKKKKKKAKGEGEEDQEEDSDEMGEEDDESEMSEDEEEAPPTDVT
jgi:type III secretion protein J